MTGNLTTELLSNWKNTLHQRGYRVTQPRLQVMDIIAASPTRSGFSPGNRQRLSYSGDAGCLGSDPANSPAGRLPWDLAHGGWS